MPHFIVAGEQPIDRRSGDRRNTDCGGEEQRDAPATANQQRAPATAPDVMAFDALLTANSSRGGSGLDREVLSHIGRTKSSV